MSAGETFLRGSGEMRTRIREFDWGRTSLGPPSQWSNSLLTMVSVLVNTHHPMFMWWGPDLIQFYNDGYRPSLGTVGRHPAALGARGREFWDEIWPAIGPQIDLVMERGESTWNQDHLVPIWRNGRIEEVYWTYGYSPVRDDDGRVGGTLVVVQEQTARVLATRRLRTLRDLAAQASAPRTQAEAWTSALGTLSENRHDLPWALIYAVSDDTEAVRLVAHNGAVVHPATDAWHSPDRTSALGRVAQTGHPQLTDDVRGFVADRVLTPWPEPVTRASLMPIHRADGRMAGILVAGLSPRLPFDAEYRDFLSMTAQQIGTALGNARMYEEEQRSVAAASEQSARFREWFQQAPAGVAVLSGPEHRFEVANPVYLEITHRPSLVGLTFAEAFPELERTELPAILGRVYQTGEPFVAHAFRIDLDRTGRGDIAQQFFSFHVACVRDTRSVIAGLIVIAVDVTPQVVGRRALVRAQERLEFTLDAAGVGYWDLDLATGFATRSLRHDQIFGYPSGTFDWTFERLLLHVPETDRVRVGESFRQALAAMRDWSVECPILGADNVLRWIQVYARVERSDDGAAARLLGVVLDVTERRDLLGREQAARREAEHASRMKDEFLTTLSHELRTPLNTILGWTELLAEGDLAPAEVEEGLATIGRNVRMQSQMIEDLLDMSRITSGMVHLNVIPLALADVVGLAVASARQAAEAKGVRILSAAGAAADDGVVSGDPDRLQQVFLNLLGNAIKFTPAGGQVSIVIERTGNRAVIAVSDTGEGIEPVFLPHVFDRFRQADARSTRAHGGLGVGLSLVKELVDLHGGTVTASSPGRGQGATFKVYLPAVPDAASVRGAGERVSLASRSRRGPISTLKSLRILLVDDDADARELMTRILSGAHADVTAASSTAEALDSLRRQTFDLLVSDIGMPHEDGYDLIRCVRLLPASGGGKIPAVAVSAYARQEDRQRAIDAGFQMHISKPFNQSELLSVCRNLTERFS